MSDIDALKTRDSTGPSFRTSQRTNHAWSKYHSLLGESERCSIRHVFNESEHPKTKIMRCNDIVEIGLVSWNCFNVGFYA